MTELKSSMNEEWKGDFGDEFVGGGSSFPGAGGDNDDDELLFSKIISQRYQDEDKSGIKVRLFSLGEDLVVSDFAGAMGFDEVTDWDYYQEDEDGRDRRKVDPNPFDPSQPRRTRESSGSVVRIFRGEFIGTLGGTLRSKGLDGRVLVKEFSGRMALDLAEREVAAIGKLQTTIPSNDDDDWIQAASSRSVLQRTDNSNICKLVRGLQKLPFMGILGEVNLAELDGARDANDFYRALGVPPPKPDAIWIVYEYAGLSSLQMYCQPAEMRRSRVPPKRGLLGVQAPPPVPEWKNRASYVRAIMKQSLEALATAHEGGIAHKSLGRSSLILSSKEQQKLVASDVYTTNPSQLLVKLADFGFSNDLTELNDESFQRARTFGVSVRTQAEAKAFSIAEDLHALAFVFVGLLLTSLAEVPNSLYQMPDTDEDTIQRQLGEIFKKDIFDFRDYVESEEIWTNVVEWLDNNGGWEMLESLWLARERVATDGGQSAREILANSQFFQ